MKSTFAIAAAAAAVAVAAPAAAATYSFELTGSYTASWQLDSNPTPASSSEQAFTLTGVTGTFPGSTSNAVDMYFWVNSGPDTGGLSIVDPGVRFLIDTTGPQLFSGPTSAPTLNTGTFLLTQYGGPGTYTLVVQDLAAPVPEPAAWAMLIAGFGLTGGALRRRPRELAARA